MKMSANPDDAYWTVGVDCGEQRHRFVVFDERSERCKQLWVRNRAEEIHEALWKLMSELPEGTKLAIVCEGLRSLAGILVQVATPLGVEIWQVNPKALDHFRDLEGQPRKDDDRDAELLALMRMRQMEGCRLAVDSRPEERVLCRLTRLHTQLVKQRATAMMRFRSRLLELCPEVVDKEWQGPGYRSKAILEVLRRWPGFLGIERARLSTIERVVRKAGRYGSRAADIARELKRVAAGVVMCEDERTVVAIELGTLIDEMVSIDNHLVDVDARIKQAVCKHPNGIKLLDMPGVGSFTVGVLLGELLPLARNVDEGKVATYAGVTPLSRISSRTSKRSKLARGVNKHAVRALYLSAVSSRRFSAIDDAYYKKQLAVHVGHPKAHVKANIAHARRRIVVMYKLMTTDAHYDKEKLIASHLKRSHREACKSDH
jgi:transposase